MGEEAVETRGDLESFLFNKKVFVCRVEFGCMKACLFHPCK